MGLAHTVHLSAHPPTDGRPFRPALAPSAVPHGLASLTHINNGGHGVTTVSPSTIFYPTSTVRASRLPCIKNGLSWTSPPSPAKAQVVDFW